MDHSKAARILFLGNSITRHGPKPEIGWTEDWGMAASALEKDYVHLLIERLSQLTGTAPQFRIESGVDLERDYRTCDVAAMAEKYREFQPGWVVLAIGENVPAFETEDDQAMFLAAVTGLLKALKENGDPALFVRSCFWQEPVRDGLLRQACQAAGGVFVDISALGGNEANYARSERLFQHDGVAAHPGDRGMQAIADAIWKAMVERGGPGVTNE
jgi:hypothetical protein